MPKMYYSQVTLIVVLIHMANDAYIVSHTILTNVSHIPYLQMSLIPYLQMSLIPYLYYSQVYRYMLVTFIVVLIHMAREAL